MNNGPFRRMAAIAAASLLFVSTAGFSQDTSVANPPTTGTGAQAPFDTTTLASPTGIADTALGDDSDNDGFPWGLLGLLGLLGLFKRGGTTVVPRDSFTPPPVDRGPRNATGTTADDRTMNLNPRPGGPNDPYRR